MKTTLRFVHYAFRSVRFYSQKNRARFIDSMRIHCRAGAGGQGQPKVGGMGGKGGDIIVKSTPRARLEDILEVTPSKRFTAGVGKDSTRRNLIGVPGEDIIIPVPVGVCVRKEDGTVLGDLDKPDQEVIVAKGAPGGSKENGYLGRRGETHMVILDLKLIADIGLVGFPNAGKSTCLSAISKAKPKIADYAFTTLRPQIGVMHYPDKRQIKMADLPGLIEGAHYNYGMGHKFLKHLDRTKLLLFIIDIEGFKLKVDSPERTAFETILLLNKELELYNRSLLQKPAVLALNKIDNDKDGTLTDSIVDKLKNLPDSLNEVDEFLRPDTLIQFDEIYKISTMFDINIETMKNRLRYLLDIYADKEAGRFNKEMLLDNVKQDVHGREHDSSRIV